MKTVFWVTITIGIFAIIRSNVPLDDAMYLLTLLTVATYVGAVGFGIDTLRENYPPAPEGKDFDNALEAILLKKDEDGIIVFKDWVREMTWALFGISVFFGIMIAQLDTETYLFAGGVILLTSTYLLYIRRKAYKRQVAER